MTVVPPVPRNGGQILMQQLRIHGARRVSWSRAKAICLHRRAANTRAPSNPSCAARKAAPPTWPRPTASSPASRASASSRAVRAPPASIGVHGLQDSTPMILFVGCVGNDFMEREAFQEIDYRRMFGPMAVGRPDRPLRPHPRVHRPRLRHRHQRPARPVVLALPEHAVGTAAVPACRATSACRTIPAPDLERLRAALDAAPSLPAAGRQRLDRQGGRAHRRLRPGFELPVGTARRRLECFDQRHPNAPARLGTLLTDALRARPRGADLILAVGTRLGEATTEGYLLPACPLPAQRLIHIPTRKNWAASTSPGRPSWPARPNSPRPPRR